MSELRPTSMSTSGDDALLRFPTPVVPAVIADGWPLQGAATAFCLTGDHFGAIHELASVHYAHSGLVALTAAPVVPGIEISIGFQTPGYTARRGVVQSCHEASGGYQIAVRFHARLAA